MPGYRSVAKVQLSFSLVSVPVKVIKATDPHGQKFHMVHPEDGGRIRMATFCRDCEQELQRSETVKGLETADGGVIMFTDEEMKSLPLATTRTIDVLQFTSFEEITPTMYDATYYLEPDGPGSVRAYALLQATLAQSGKVGVAKVAFREGRERLAVLRVEGNLLAITTLLWPEEVRNLTVEALDNADVAPAELKMAKQLVDSMTEPFNPANYVDDYQAALAELVDAKLAGETLVSTTPAAKPEPASNLADLLAASISASEKPAEKPAKPSRAKKAS